MELVTARGFFFGGINCGIKTEKLDLGVIVSSNMAQIFGVTTTNRFAASSVLWTRAIIKNNQCRAILVNSGNANACTGKSGFENTEKSAMVLAAKLGCEAKHIAISSTGIIGVQLPIDKIFLAVPDLIKKVSPDSTEFSQAIMTTDLTAKTVCRQIFINGTYITINGFAKGSGMIGPNMATMLGYLVTDIKLKYELLDEIFKSAINASFNKITVDGDTSTNDTVLLLANGAAGNNELSVAEIALFKKALTEACQELAWAVVRDGEGATKFITIHVQDAASTTDAEIVAKSIANSPLVKTAFFGENPNWGRVLMAVGKCAVTFQPENVGLKFGPIELVKHGLPIEFSKKEASDYLKNKDVELTVSLGAGNANATVWTCDFSYNYVKINAEYS